MPHQTNPFRNKRQSGTFSVWREDERVLAAELRFRPLDARANYSIFFASIVAPDC